MKDILERKLLSLIIPLGLSAGAAAICAGACAILSAEVLYNVLITTSYCLLGATFCAAVALEIFERKKKKTTK